MKKYVKFILRILTKHRGNELETNVCFSLHFDTHIVALPSSTNFMNESHIVFKCASDFHHLQNDDYSRSSKSRKICGRKKLIFLNDLFRNVTFIQLLPY